MKLHGLSFVFIFLLISISCKKKSEPVPYCPPSKTCYIKQIRADKRGMLENIEYVDGRVSRVYANWTFGDEIREFKSELTYYNDSVVETMKGPGFDDLYKYKIGSNGKIDNRTFKRVTQTSNGIPTAFEYDTTTYEYDIDGYLVKQDHINVQMKEDGTYSNKNTYSVIFTIDNGNVISATTYSNGIITSTTIYEYYSDLINRTGYGDAYVLWPEAFGKLTKNLLKKTITENATTEYFYDLDQYGNVIKQKVSNNGGPVTTSIDEVIYDCY